MADYGAAVHRDQGALGYVMPNTLLKRQRAPVDQPVPQQAWYLGLISTFCSHCSNVALLCEGQWCRFYGGKLEASVNILCSPCIVLMQAVNEQRTYFRQSGIVYLYLYLSITVVVNLIVPLRKVDVPSANKIQLYFVFGCIVVAITMMFYLWLFARETATYRDWNFRAGYPPEALMRVFYQAGLYLFGFLSFGYSLGNAIDYITCGCAIQATVNMLKALYIVLQTLFLNRFYKARIPDDTRGIQVVMAHLLGTNLALWFWTLCSEEVSESVECTSYPFPLRNTDKYFSPLFVEYLLIAATLFYQIWQDLLPTEQILAPHCPTCACQINEDNHDAGEADHRQRDEDRDADVKRRVAASRGLGRGYGIIIGCCFGVVFILLVIASAATGEEHQIYHKAYASGVISLYFTQFFACYIILLSAQSLAWDTHRTSLDHDDALLYISLVGSLLWEGFHLYSLILIEFNPGIDDGLVADSNVRHIDTAADTLAILQYVFQTASLIKLRRHQPTMGRRPTWICQCLLFLLTTNIGLWVENSFFVEIIISTPGEKYTSIQKNLKPLGYILHPLNIFFRFHSAVYCLIAWSIFKG